MRDHGRVGHRRSVAFAAVGEAVEVEVDDRGGEEGEHLAEDEAADDGVAKRLAEFGAVAVTQGQRDAADHRGERRHHDRAETF